MKIKLGQKVKDTVTGFQGTVTMRAECLGGPVLIEITAAIGDYEYGRTKSLTMCEARAEVVKDESEPVEGT